MTRRSYTLPRSTTVETSGERLHVAVIPCRAMDAPCPLCVAAKRRDDRAPQCVRPRAQPVHGNGTSPQVLTHVR